MEYPNNFMTTLLMTVAIYYICSVLNTVLLFHDLQQYLHLLLV